MHYQEITEQKSVGKLMYIFIAMLCTFYLQNTVAMEMIKEGASLEFISKVTKLTMEELEKLKKHI